MDVVITIILMVAAGVITLLFVPIMYSILLLPKLIRAKIKYLEWRMRQ